MYPDVRVYPPVYLKLSGGTEKFMQKLIKKCIAGLLCTAIVFVTCQIASFASNASASEYVANLKTAWQAMYTETKIANLKTDKLVQNFATAVDVSTAGITFNEDNTADKTAVDYDDKNTGIIFQNSDKWGSAWFDKDNRFNNYTNVFDDSKYDALGVTFKTGNVTTAGKAYLLCTYSDYNSTESAKIDITVEDSNKTVMLDTKTLFGKKLSELLKNGTYDLKLLKVGFSKDLEFKGAELSDLYALKYVTLPENSQNFTLMDWYNAASEVNTALYKNTEGFVTALKKLDAYIQENDEVYLQNNLAKAWTAMYTETKIANLKTDKLVQNFATAVDVSTAGITFNEDNTADKTAVDYDDKNTGIIFQNSDKWGSAWFDKDNRFNNYTNVFDDSKYDALGVTFKTGNVTTAGKAYLLCTYSDYNSTESAKIDITVEDSNKTVMLDTKTLFGKKLSELLKNGTYDLKLLKVGFSKDLEFKGAELSDLYALKYVTLPENSQNFTLMDWYNAASEVNTALYKNTEGFVTALKELGDYLEENDDSFTKNKLAKTWTSMYTETKIADLYTKKVVGDFSSASEPSTAGISFNSDNTVNKTAAEYDDKNKGIIFSNSDAWGSFWFDNGANNRGPKYADVFNDNNYDALRVTFKTGTVTAPGKAYLLCTYSDYTSVMSQQIEIGLEDNGKTVNLDTKALFGIKLSELLTKGQDSNGNDITLKIIKIGFSKDLAFEGAEISELNALKYATLPENSENFTLLEWYNAAVSFNTAVYKNTQPFAEAVKNLQSKLFTPEEIAVEDLKTAWTKMYTNTFFATLYSPKNVEISNKKGITVNENASIDAGMLYATGDELYSINKPKGVDYNLTFYDRGGKYECLSLARKVKDYDTITIYVYTGTVKNAGTVYIEIVDKEWKTEKILLNLKPEDSNKWIEVDVLNSLGYGSMKDFVDHEDEKKNPSSIHFNANGSLEAEGLTVGMAAGRNYVKFPEGDLTPKQILDAALELETDGYLGAQDFDSALNNLYKAINGKDLPNLPPLDFSNSEADIQINIKRLSRVDDISVSGISVGKVPVAEEIANWISDKGFVAISNSFSVDLVDGNSKTVDIENRKAEICFNLPDGVNANEVNLLEIDGDKFKLVNCVYYEEKLVFDTDNFTNGKSYAILILS